MNSSSSLRPKGERFSGVTKVTTGKVEFCPASLLASAVPFIRGERVLLPRSWEKIPLNAFILKDPIKGQAEVRLGPPVVDRTRLESIVSIAKTNTYVVDEMRFNLADKTMTIIVTPY
ncbi:MAG: hypothetical protein U7127_04050 [Phormidium sp.]